MSKNPGKDAVRWHPAEHDAGVGCRAAQPANDGVCPPFIQVAEIGVSQLVPENECKLRIRASDAKQTRGDDDPLVGRKGVHAGIDLKLNGNRTCDCRDDRVHPIITVAADKDLNGPLAVVPDKLADPSAGAMTRNRLVVEGENLVAGPDTCDRSWRIVSDR